MKNEYAEQAGEKEYAENIDREAKDGAYIGAI